MGEARWEIEAPDPEATRSIGAAIGGTAPEGAVLLLEGPLGAGKTTFAQGVGSGCGVSEPVASPTYNLILHYRGERPFTHVDLYRLEDAAGLETLDLDEILAAEGVTCVEWPELLRSSVGEPRAEIRFGFADEDDPEGPRRIEGTLHGGGWGESLASLRGLGARIEGEASG
ncbi:MAG: tRNA (adenosine(37)-N6)-threonylcarbamoyltransferase complex ATPase subunit type 1 TsaE [Gemmatimonadota bacterium]|nr:tRNA (adenosine(37)-N6)-threonylcarbamoyltransferase complex ATPase subunit type 1 TsaE [Gemmatimonadota bacterium]